jgi:hypothetical protein
VPCRPFQWIADADLRKAASSLFRGLNFQWI